MDGSSIPCESRAPAARVRPELADIEVADGRRVHVRALTPQDSEAVRLFFRALSPNSRYQRFFSGGASPPESVLRALTEIDQRRHVAFVAISARAAGTDEAPRIVADARYVWQDVACSAEFAIAIADDWQRQGLGSELMRRLAEYAEQSGVRSLFGHVLKKNGPMTALVRALGGNIVADPQDDALCLAKIDLKLAEPPLRRTESRRWRKAECHHLGGLLLRDAN